MVNKQVDLREAQWAFKDLEKPMSARLYQNMTCPRNCEGRTKNKGNCTPENCVVVGERLDKNRISLAAIKKVSSQQQGKVRVRHLDRRDSKLLDNISMYGKVTSGVHYRNHERPEIKKQLETLGLSMPRLKNVDRVKLREINEVRVKLGLKQLADLSHLITGKPNFSK